MRYQGPVTLELGRYFAACAGSYATRIVDIKTNLGRRYCIVDGGIHQVNYYGQLLATKRPPVEVVPARSGGRGALHGMRRPLYRQRCAAQGVPPFRSPGRRCADLRPYRGLFRGGRGGCPWSRARDPPQVALCSARDGLRLVRAAGSHGSLESGNTDLSNSIKIKGDDSYGTTAGNFGRDRSG